MAWVRHGPSIHTPVILLRPTISAMWRCIILCNSFLFLFFFFTYTWVREMEKERFLRLRKNALGEMPIARGRLSVRRLPLRGPVARGLAKATGWAPSRPGWGDGSGAPAAPSSLGSEHHGFEILESLDSGRPQRWPCTGGWKLTWHHWKPKVPWSPKSD